MRARKGAGRGLLVAVLAAGLTAGVAEPAPAQSLDDRVSRAGDGPVRFHFAAREGVCGYGDGIGLRRPGGEGWTTMRWSFRGGSRDVESLCEPGPVRVELAVRGGRVTGVETRVGRAGAERGTALGEVPAAEAARYLLSLAARAGEEVGEEALLPVALAAAGPLHPDLLRLAADSDVPGGTREQAVFWAVELGAPVAELVRLFDRVDDPEVREAVLFGWGRGDDPRGARELLRVARSDAPRALREKAVFWLGQSAGRVVTRDLGELVDDEAVDDEVREHAVFALSRRPADEGVPALLRIARTHPSAALRRKAMFWLAESGDPRALELFEQILLPRPGSRQ